MKGTAYDKEGNVVLCDKCDKEATYIIECQTATARYCYQHTGFPYGEESHFIFEPHEHPAHCQAPPILNDAWVKEISLKPVQA